MLAVFERQRQLFGAFAWSLFAIVLAGPAWADTVTVHVDQAKLLKLPDQVATVVIGNPLIADATLQSGSILVVTGKGYGATNLIALDRHGRVLVRDSLQVVKPTGNDLIVMYKGTNRETYSCAPQCQPRIMLGDSVHTPEGQITTKTNSYYDRNIKETHSRQTGVEGKGD